MSIASVAAGLAAWAAFSAVGVVISGPVEVLIRGNEILTDGPLGEVPELYWPESLRASSWGGTCILANLPSNAWLLLAVHDGSNQARAATSTGWVRCKVTGEVPLSVPIGLTAGDYGLSIKNTEGALAGLPLWLSLRRASLRLIRRESRPMSRQVNPPMSLRRSPPLQPRTALPALLQRKERRRPRHPLMGQIRMIWLSLAPQQPC